MYMLMNEIFVYLSIYNSSNGYLLTSDTLHRPFVEPSKKPEATN